MAAGKLIIGTRGSALALAQATLLREALLAAHPGLDVETQVIHTTGDKRLDLKLASASHGHEKVPKGLFTKELELALQRGEIDVAVHSLKDLPTEMAPDLVWAATLPRERVEDVLVTREPASNGATGLGFLPQGGLVTTSSIRRARLLHLYRPDLVLDEIRGNVPTRLRKLADNPAMSGTLLAFAGLERLGLLSEDGRRITVPDGPELYATILDSALFPPAVGQGAIGLQCRAGDEPVFAVLKAINHQPTFTCAQAERAFLQGLGGSCQTPVGVHSRLSSATGSGEPSLILHCMVFPDAPGGAPFRGSLYAPSSSAVALGRQLAGEAIQALAVNPPRTH